MKEYSQEVDLMHMHQRFKCVKIQWVTLSVTMFFLTSGASLYAFSEIRDMGQ